MPGTPLTDPEWTFLHPIFPNLVRAETSKTGDEDKDYNCIAWALGITTEWVDPPESQADFTQLCKC